MGSGESAPGPEPDRADFPASPVRRHRSRPGFGTRLLERALGHDLGEGAAVELHFELGGPRATIRFVPRGTTG
ncbi:hypothetical protein [Roseicella aerolata]|uniref:Uncharacterized protein n=1 Tax=Roseicella aerolata TaxID=2883479 RepID=A0A9X1IH65_9PROT|nr:hypothetical protein [Roseicella aerolata]MCB4824502.1 hypothetical protein [Roseicella aerolata]